MGPTAQGRSRHIRIDFQQLGRQVRRIAMPGNIFATGPPKLLAKRRGAGKTHHRIGQSLDIPKRDDVACTRPLHNVRRVPRGSRDHRQTCGHCFENDIGRPFRFRTEDKYSCLLENVHDILAKSRAA